MNVLMLKNVDFSANCLESVELNRIHTESISVSPTTLTLDAIGATAQITATVYPSDSEDSVTFRSTNENVATVSNTGLVEIVGVGTCNIIATSYNKTSTCAVSVTVELSSGKFRNTVANAANDTNMLTSLSTASQAGAADNYMLMCNGESEFNHLMIEYNMTKLRDGVYVVQLPSEMDTTRKRIYNVTGYPIPAILPNNTTKIRCIAPTANYAVYPLIFKHDVEAYGSGSGTTNRGHYSPARALISPQNSYDYVFQAVTDIDIPSGYDSVAITFKSNGTDSDFRNMSESMLNEFKIICM